MLVLIITVVHAFQLIPVRGRKLHELVTKHRRTGISTYPRKGTETREPSAGTYGSLRFQLIPARGRKQEIIITKLALTVFQLIPARGRKHKEDDSGFYFAELFQLIPARGQKTPHQKWCGVFLLRALTFRFSWAIPL